MENATVAGNPAWRLWAIIMAGMLLLACLDIVVLERIYKPIVAKHHVPWETFQVNLPIVGKSWGVLWWHVGFLPGGVILFLLFGWAARDWRVAVGGTALFVTGWEDLFYYLAQLQLPPESLPWLDHQPGVAWTRLLTGSGHVTRAGLLISALVGAAAMSWLAKCIRNRG